MSYVFLETGLTLPTDRECKQWNIENDAVMEEISLRSPVKDKFKTWRVKGYQDGVSRFRFSVKGRSIYRPEELEFNISSIIVRYNLVSPPSLHSEFLFCVGKEVDSK